MGALVGRALTSECPIEVIVTTRPALDFAATMRFESWPWAVGCSAGGYGGGFFEMAGVVLEPARVSETIAEVHALTGGRATSP